VVRREKLQLVGIACMLIAAKYEEIFPPTVDDFVYISDNTYCKAEVPLVGFFFTVFQVFFSTFFLSLPVMQVLEMESQILKALSFSMTVVTPMAYLDHYSSHVADVTEPELFSLAHYVCELNMIEPVLCFRPTHFFDFDDVDLITIGVFGKSGLLSIRSLNVCGGLCFGRISLAARRR
jgi:cyclin A